MGYLIRIFIDALDECGEKDARQLVSYFQQLTSPAESISVYASCVVISLSIALGKGLEICVEKEISGIS